MVRLLLLRITLWPKPLTNILYTFLVKQCFGLSKIHSFILISSFTKLIVIDCSSIMYWIFAILHACTLKYLKYLLMCSGRCLKYTLVLQVKCLKCLKNSIHGCY